MWTRVPDNLVEDRLSPAHAHLWAQVGKSAAGRRSPRRILRSPPAASHGTVDSPPSRRVPPSCAHRPQGWPTLRSGDVKQKLTIAPAHCAWRGSAPDHLPGGVSVADRFIPAPPSPLALSDAPVHVSPNKHFCKRCGGQPPGCMKAPRPHAAPRRALTSPRSDELCSSRAPTRAGGHRARGGPAVARCSGCREDATC